MIYIDVTASEPSSLRNHGRRGSPFPFFPTRNSERRVSTVFTNGNFPFVKTLRGFYRRWIAARFSFVSLFLFLSFFFFIRRFSSRVASSFSRSPPCVTCQQSLIHTRACVYVHAHTVETVMDKTVTVKKIAGNLWFVIKLDTLKAKELMVKWCSV